MLPIQKSHTADNVLSHLHEYRTYIAAYRRSEDTSNRSRFAARAGVALRAMRAAAKMHNAIAVSA